MGVCVKFFVFFVFMTHQLMTKMTSLLMFLFISEKVIKKEHEQKSEDNPPLYFLSLKLIVPGSNDAVPIQV